MRPERVKRYRRTDARFSFLALHGRRRLDLGPTFPPLDDHFDAQELLDRAALGCRRAETPKTDIELEHVAVAEPPTFLTGPLAGDLRGLRRIEQELALTLAIVAERFRLGFALALDGARE